MFLDERLITVRSGAGGDGIVAWRREKFVPEGGPGGGDGGRGGDVLLRADPELTTFGDMEQVRRVKAEAGERGRGDRQTGAQGADRVLAVPVGTSVYDAATGDLLADLVAPGTTFLAARGGRGGRGNARFASATDQRPTHAEPGGVPEERTLRLELRLLADVGLVGLPNAGKSTLLARVTAATPRIADYPFTTLEPYLGIVDLADQRRFVIADLPGLIAGAHRGRGLGDRFLRHVERTRVLLHLVDVAPVDGSDPVEAYRTVRRELEAYGHGLATRPEIVAATKVDALPPGPPGRRPEGDHEGEGVLRRLAEAADRKVHPISAVTGSGLRALMGAVAKAVEAAEPPPGPPARLPPASDAPPDGGPEGPGCSTTSSSTSR
jgi:GTP-binding protein